MKKSFLTILIFMCINSSVFATENSGIFKLRLQKNDTRAIKSLLNSQVRYANKADFNKFILTYDKNYKNADGFNLETYSNLVKDIWETYDNIVYGIKIKNMVISDENALVNLEETSYAQIPLSKEMNGTLVSNADSVYSLQKTDGKWRVVSDKVLRETTSMLYGEARNLDIKLTAPETITPNTEYCASLEFVPPEGTTAIASIAMDKVEYPQKEAKEVFRKFPDDNILERLFISNTENKNEYIVASIGLTKTDITDTSIKVSLVGFGYQITRVNVLSQSEEENVKSK